MDKDEVLETTNEAEKVDTLTTEEREGEGTLESAEFTDDVESVKEENEAKFSQDDLDRIVKDRLSRQEQKIREEYEEKYGRVETVLKAGLGTKDISEATERLTDFYKAQGVEIPETKLTPRQEQILANAEVEEIIADGYDEIVKYVDNLARKGADKMTSKEKLIFTKLAEERTRQEGIKQLAEIGVGKGILEDREFLEFSNKLNPSLSIREKYDMYEKLKPRKKIETMGTMRGNGSKDGGVKEFYSREEALKFTKQDFDKNPKLFEAVEKSMLKW